MLVSPIKILYATLLTFVSAAPSLTQSSSECKTKVSSRSPSDRSVDISLVTWPDLSSPIGELRRAHRGISNAELLRRGLPLNKPAQLYKSNKVALAPRWSGAPSTDSAQTFAFTGCGIYDTATCSVQGRCLTGLFSITNRGTRLEQTAEQKLAAVDDCIGLCEAQLPGNLLIDLAWTTDTSLNCDCGWINGGDNVECSDANQNSAYYQLSPP